MCQYICEKTPLEESFISRYLNIQISSYIDDLCLNVSFC